MFLENELEQVLEAALAEGGDFADIFMERKLTTGIKCEDNRVERINSGTDLGAGVRVISGEATSYAYTNDLSLSGLLQVAGVAAKAARGGRNKAPIKVTRSVPAVDFSVELSPDTVPVADKVEQVSRANRAARETNPAVKQVSVVYGDVIQEVTVANSEGLFVEDRRVRSRFVVNAVAAAQGHMQTGYEALGGTAGFELLRRNSVEELAKTAAQRAVMLLTADPAPAGKMPVVMTSEAGGTMVHEACGHGLEADLIQKGLSVYAGKIGRQVAAPQVTVIDDALVPGKYGTCRIDDEGRAGQKKVLIEKGMLRGYMYDYLTARKDRCSSTGNGRRESYREKPIPRMTNTYIAPGGDDPEKIIRNTPYGLLVRKMGGGQVNTTNGDFVFDVAEGYLIQEGEIVKPVRGATITGNGPAALNMVDMVGNDLGFAIGTCGKEGQGAPVSDAQPTLRIKELIVGGTASGSEKVTKKIRRM